MVYPYCKMIKPSITGNKLALSLEPHRDSGGYSACNIEPMAQQLVVVYSYSPKRPYNAHLVAISYKYILGYWVALQGLKSPYII